jgi:hypothetical protein
MLLLNMNYLFNIEKIISQISTEDIQKRLGKVLNYENKFLF